MRFQSAEEMAVALENIVRIASPREVGRLVESLGGSALRERTAMVADVESTSHVNLSVAADVAKADATMRDSMDVEVDMEPAPVQETQSAFHARVETSPSTGARRLWVVVATVAVFAGSGLGIGSWFAWGRGSTSTTAASTTAASTNLAQVPTVSAAQDVPSNGLASAASSLAEPSPLASASASATDTTPVASSVPAPVAPVRTAAGPARTKNDPKPDVPSVTDFGGRE
jgi:hypothetical protein